MQGLNNNELLKLLNLPPKELQDAVDDKIRQTCLKITNLPHYFDSHIIVPKAVYDVKGNYAAWAVGGYTIRVNTEALVKHTQDMLHQTIPHEVAHIAMQQWYPTERIAHGAKWQMLMIRMGLVPHRCHSYDNLTPARKHKREYIYVCSCLGRVHKLKKNRHTRCQTGTDYFCTVCHKPIVYSHKSMED